MSSYVSKTKFAKLADVSVAAVSKACKNRRLLGRATSQAGLIDTNHIQARTYLEKHSSPTPTVDIDGPLPPPEDAPENVRELLDLTLAEVIARFGTGERFLTWLKAVKNIELVREKRVKNLTAEGQLVDRELVERGLVEPIDTAHKRLLSDGSRTIAQRVAAMVQAGQSVSEMERFIHDHIGQFIRRAKSEAQRNLGKEVTK